MAIEITESRVIICEGKSDVAFFEHLIQERGLPPFQVLEAGGRSGYEHILVALSVAHGFDRISGILIVADNDLDPSASFECVQAQIRSAEGYAVPNRSGEVVKSAGYPAILVLMVPWHEKTGCLETLLIQAIYGFRPHFKACVEAYAACAHTDRWNEVEQSKMKVQVAISAACKSDPNTPVSYAWSRQGPIIPLDNSCFNEIADFLRRFDTLIA